MKLLKISIANFRGISKLVFEPQGHNVNIFGENGSGKTTVEDAFLWLTHGKDSEDRKDYDLKPHDVDGVPIIGQGLEPTVEAVLEHEGKQITLKKVYAEQWPKNRDTKVKEYVGSKVIYYVNDLEVKAGDYQQAVSKLISEDVFKLITNPRYFSETLSWQDRRATLVKIAGPLDVDEGKDLLTQMCFRSFEEFYALCKQQSKEKSKTIDAIPAVINEARRNIPQVEGDAKKIWHEAGDLKVRKIGLETELSNLKNDTAMNQKRRDVANTETEIIQARATYEKGIETENSTIAHRIDALKDDRASKYTSQMIGENTVTRLENELAQLLLKGADLKTTQTEIEAGIWEGATDCPTCGRDLPEDQIEAAKVEFNTNRSNKLIAIRERGKAINSDYKLKLGMVTDERNKIIGYKNDIAVLETRTKNECTNFKARNFEATDVYISLQAKLDGLRERVKGAAASNKQEKIDALQTDIDALQEGIAEKDKLKIQLDQKAEQEKRVVELMAQEKSLNAELEQIQKSIHMCEKYVKAKTRALEISVNGKFKIVKFQLFEMQKNGEESECCNTLYPNGSTNLSTGEKLQAGIDIISTLSAFYGVSAPIWIDDAESITKGIETSAQIIRMFVTETDKILRIEVVN